MGLAGLDRMRSLLVATLALSLFCPVVAPAATPQSTLDQAGDIVTQPVRDLGIDKKEIPAVLKRAVRSPYARKGTSSCSRIRSAMSDLDDALGPDFGRRTTRRGSTVGTIAKMGGSSIVNGLIPFRGIVREVSGAAAQQRRLAEAVNAGYARRGFLHGMYALRNCR
jgi:hypothetical protein